MDGVGSSLRAEKTKQVGGKGRGLDGSLMRYPMFVDDPRYYFRTYLFYSYS